MGITLLPNKNGGKMEKKQDAVTQTEEKTEATVGESTATENKEAKETKTYTQEEYNALDIRLKKQYEKKYEGIDVAKYREWEESQKTEAQKQAELVQKMTDTSNQNSQLLKQLSIAKQGITNDDDIDYIVYKVSKMEGDFEENLKEFLKDNPKFLQKESVAVETPKTTGVAVQKINENAESGVSALLKAKHPDLF